MKVIIDTNIFVIALIGKSQPYIEDYLVNKNFRLLFSQESLTELITVLRRPKFKKIFSEEQIITLLSLIYENMDVIDIKSDLTVCRDKKDNFLLNLAFDSKADYLITEDYDLLEIKAIGQTKIIKYQEFAKLIKLKIV